MTEYAASLDRIDAALPVMAEALDATSARRERSFINSTPEGIREIDKQIEALRRDIAWAEELRQHVAAEVPAMQSAADAAQAERDAAAADLRARKATWLREHLEHAKVLPEYAAHLEQGWLLYVEEDALRHQARRDAAGGYVLPLDTGPALPAAVKGTVLPGAEGKGNEPLYDKRRRTHLPGVPVGYAVFFE